MISDSAGAGRDLDISLKVKASLALTLYEAVEVVFVVIEDNLKISVVSGEKGGWNLWYKVILYKMKIIVKLLE